MSSVAVIGAGAWGTALAIQAARAGNDVTLWARDPARAADDRRQAAKNPRLPGVTAADVDAGCRYACPAPPTRCCWPCRCSTCAACWPACRLSPAPLVVCAKGVETGTLRLPLEVVAELRPRTPAAVLTGPNFAHEIAAGLPAAAVVAASDAGAARQRRRRCSAPPTFRLYGNDDPVGAQVGGAAKNVDRHRRRRGDRRRPGRERPRRADHPRPGRTVAAGRGARRPGGDGDGPVRPGRPAADLHRPGQPQLQPGPGARPRREAGRRPGRPQHGHRGRRHRPRPGGARRRVSTCRSAPPSPRCWRDAPRWPRRWPLCWRGRAATNDATSARWATAVRWRACSPSPTLPRLRGRGGLVPPLPRWRAGAA